MTLTCGRCPSFRPPHPRNPDAAGICTDESSSALFVRKGDVCAKTLVFGRFKLKDSAENSDHARTSEGAQHLLGLNPIV